LCKKSGHKWSTRASIVSVDRASKKVAWEEAEVEDREFVEHHGLFVFWQHLHVRAALRACIVGTLEVANNRAVAWEAVNSKVPAMVSTTEELACAADVDELSAKVVIVEPNHMSASSDFSGANQFCRISRVAHNWNGEWNAS